MIQFKLDSKKESGKLDSTFEMCRNISEACHEILGIEKRKKEIDKKDGYGLLVSM